MAFKKDSSQTATYSRRLKDNVKSILDNYIEIVNQSKINPAAKGTTESHISHVESEVKVRASNIVRAVEALSKLTSDVKENMILNDFSFINKCIEQRSSELEKLKADQLAELEQLHTAVQKKIKENS
ncbi:mediator of RNA polymerase II transcription subunit 22-like [Dysidea avara]|uniref:mediator of RNA polymerase II transcription subunit 22-like n=1 Tax=Dysidea avara TaxID=196820 RepID=UPI00331DB428